MCNVTLCSAFRNAVGYITQHRLQVCRLAHALRKRGDHLHVIWCEGDSTDDTHARLLDAYARDGAHCGYTADIFQHHHGGPDYGSIEHPERFRLLAGVYNAIWQRIPQDANVALLVGSDLIWETETLLQLIDDLEHLPPPFGAVAPMVMDGARSFYDVWAFRMDGQRFTKEPPYLPRRTRNDLIEGNLIRIDSAGGVLVMDGELARKVRFTDDEEIVGLCKAIYACGGSIWLQAGATVTHP